MSDRGGGHNPEHALEEARVHALGKDLVSRLAMLLKTVRIHSVHNEALKFSVRIFVESANSLFGHLGDFTMRGDKDAIFINDIRIRPEIILWDNIVHLMKEMARRGAGGLVFSGTVSPQATRSLIEVLLDHEELDPEVGAALLNEKLAGHRVSSVSFLPRLSLVTHTQQVSTVGGGGKGGGAGGAGATAGRSVRVYSELLVTWRAYLESRQGQVPEVLRLRLLHAVQAAVDMLHEDHRWFIATASYRDQESYLAVHSVNMAVLSMAVGNRLELGRKALMNLGMSALYADSGMRRLTDNLVAPNEEEEEALTSHPFRSVMEIMESPALTRAQRDRILVAYEHHIGLDGSGFPLAIPGKPKHLFSHIITLADRYDELTSDRPDQEALSPIEAIEILYEESELYDHRLLPIFVNMLSPVPVGTVVQLSTGEVAVVASPAESSALNLRPIVRIVLSPDAVAVAPVSFDLTSRGPDGRFLAHIVEVLPKDVLEGVGIAEVLFSSADYVDLGGAGTE